MPISRHCSSGYGPAFILDPAPSCLLRAWLLAIHALTAIGLLCLPTAWTTKVGLLLVLAGHGMLRRPAPPERIVRNRNGLWALPESGQTGLSLSASSRYGTWWAELHLIRAGWAYRCLLCRDQLAAGQWRKLQLALRRPQLRAYLS